MSTLVLLQETTIVVIGVGVATVGAEVVIAVDRIAVFMPPSVTVCHALPAIGVRASGVFPRLHIAKFNC